MLAEQVSPHVIVVDVGPDESAAADICRNIKASPAFGSAKVIATGAQIDQRLGQRLSAVGFDACLRKPYTAADLVRAVEEATNLIT